MYDQNYLSQIRVLLSGFSTWMCRLDRAEITEIRAGPARKIVFPYPDGHKISAVKSTRGVRMMTKGKSNSHTINRGRISLAFILFPSTIWILIIIGIMVCLSVFPAHFRPKCLPGPTLPESHCEMPVDRCPQIRASVKSVSGDFLQSDS